MHRTIDNPGVCFNKKDVNWEQPTNLLHQHGSTPRPASQRKHGQASASTPMDTRLQKTHPFCAKEILQEILECFPSSATSESPMCGGCIHLPVGVSLGVSLVCVWANAASTSPCAGEVQDLKSRLSLCAGEPPQLTTTGSLLGVVRMDCGALSGCTDARSVLVWVQPMTICSVVNRGSCKL